MKKRELAAWALDCSASHNSVQRGFWEELEEERSQGLHMVECRAQRSDTHCPCRPYAGPAAAADSSRGRAVSDWQRGFL